MCVTFINVHVVLTILCLLILDNSLHSILVLGGNRANRTLRDRHELYKYRSLQWCVTGKDEPELHQWPFNQFVPLLRRSGLRLHRDENFRYKLEFYEVHSKQRDMGDRGRLYKTVHVVVKGEGKRPIALNIQEQWNPLLMEGLILQANYNPEKLGLPAGEFFPVNSQVNCVDCNSTQWGQIIPCRKRSIIHMVHPTVMVFHYQMRPHKFVTYEDTVGKQSEIHINFRWYSPPCAQTRHLQFYVLAVRSFEGNKFDVVKLGPYEVTIRGQGFQADISPSPYYEKWTQEAMCHAKSSTDITTEQPSQFDDLEMSSKFDCCTKYEDNPRNPFLKDFNVTKFSFNCSAITNSSKLNAQYNIKYGAESYLCNYPKPVKCSWDTRMEERDILKSLCKRCLTVPTTTTVAPTVKATRFIKRSVHGLLMIMTNFCLQPIVVYIARFYKETYNEVGCKGTKNWYWMHMLGGMVSSTLVYYGYFSGGDEENVRIQYHVVIGNVYIIILAVCYMTAWGRNKNYTLNIIMEFIHGCMGYIVITIALASIGTLPEGTMGLASQVCIYFMFAFQMAFMIAMTCHICCLDAKFGMKPRRRHFPTVEARFDEVQVPGGRFRRIMLLIFWTTTFFLSTGSTWMD